MKIIPLPIKSIDERGFTCEYYHDRMGQSLIIYRKAGTTSGQHYHKGISLTKNPEILIILNGACTISWRSVYDTKLNVEKVQGPVRLEIAPYTYHELYMETDCCCIELNSISEHETDTFYIS